MERSVAEMQKVNMGRGRGKVNNWIWLCSSRQWLLRFRDWHGGGDPGGWSGSRQPWDNQQPRQSLVRKNQGAAPQRASTPNPCATRATGRSPYRRVPCEGGRTMFCFWGRFRRKCAPDNLRSYGSNRGDPDDDGKKKAPRGRVSVFRGACIL